MAEKYPKLGTGPNPYIDPAGYKAELDIVEGVFDLNSLNSRSSRSRGSRSVRL